MCVCDRRSEVTDDFHADLKRREFVQILLRDFSSIKQKKVLTFCLKKQSEMVIQCVVDTYG